MWSQGHQSETICKVWPPCSWQTTAITREYQDGPKLSRIIVAILDEQPWSNKLSQITVRILDDVYDNSCNYWWEPNYQAISDNCFCNSWWAIKLSQIIVAILDEQPWSNKLSQITVLILDDQPRLVWSLLLQFLMSNNFVHTPIPSDGAIFSSPISSTIYQSCFH